MLAIIGFVITLSTYPNSVARTAQAWESFEKPNPFTYVVTPGSGTVEQGTAVAPSIEFTGDDVPKSVTFAFKTDVEESYRNRPMIESESKIFEAQELDVTNTLSYYIQMDGFPD